MKDDRITLQQEGSMSKVKPGFYWIRNLSNGRWRLMEWTVIYVNEDGYGDVPGIEVQLDPSDLRGCKLIHVPTPDEEGDHG